MTDAELVRGAREGQRAALQQLVRRYAPRLLAVCRARIGRDEAAEDLAQETLIRGMKRLHTLKDPDKVGAWLRGIAIRVCLDWLRSRRREQVPFSNLTVTAAETDTLAISDDVPSHTLRLEQQERQEHLLAAIDALPEDLREPLLLFYYDEATYEQIAELLGVSRATVNTRLAGARARLARQLAHLMR